MKRVSVFLVAILAVVLTLASPAVAQPETPPAGTVARAATAAVPAGVPDGAEPATVANYSDARAFVVDLAGKETTVVLIGLDAPDLHAGPSGECFAAEATAKLRALLPVGTVVYLEADAKGDDGQGHLLRWVWRTRDGGKPATLLNQTLVRGGYAAADTGGENARYRDRLAQAEAAAQQHHAGLWQACGGPHVPLTAAPTPVPTTSGTSSGPSSNGTSGSSSGDTSGASGGTSGEASGGGTDTGTYVGGDGCTYRNVDGVQVSCPVQSDTAPPGATGRCNDGTWTFALHHQGACSHHGGVAYWL
jgi:endonuclease YncB( thermonuclease family)